MAGLLAAGYVMVRESGQDILIFSSLVPECSPIRRQALRWWVVENLPALGAASHGLSTMTICFCIISTWCMSHHVNILH